MSKIENPSCLMIIKVCRQSSINTSVFNLDICLINYDPINVYEGLAGRSDSKESACNAGDLGSIPGLERYPGEGNGYPLQ